MDTFNKDDLKTLAEMQEEACVSLYMPVVPGGLESGRNHVVLRNLLREAGSALAERGVSEETARTLTETAEQRLGQELRGGSADEGLTAFFSPTIFRAYRLPLAFSEQVAVGEHFAIRPLLPLLNGDGVFYILALSQNATQLYKANLHHIAPLTVEDIPAGLAETLRYDDLERQLQYHTSTTRGAAIFHGHSADGEDRKEDLLRYCREIDQGLHPLLREERAPLILAGVEYLFPLYREANTYPHLLEEGIPGNQEHSGVEELHRHGWKLAQPLFQEERKRGLDLCKERMGTGLASLDIAEIVPAARYGRVEALFLAANVPQWGVFDREANAVHVHLEAEPGSEDLADYAAAQTLLHGGAAYIVEPSEMPNHAPIAALLRY